MMCFQRGFPLAGFVIAALVAASVVAGVVVLAALTSWWILVLLPVAMMVPCAAMMAAMVWSARGRPDDDQRGVGAAGAASATDAGSACAQFFNSFTGDVRDAADRNQNDLAAPAASSEEVEK